MSKKLAIIVGHNSKSKGAVRVDNDQSEFEFNSALAQSIQSYASGGLDCLIFFRRPGVGYPQEVKDVYKEVDEWGADAAIELHFNFAGKTATGTEVLSSGTAGSMALAGYVQSEMVDCLGLADRGVKVRDNGGRGSASLMAGKAPTILIEPFFGSNRKDCEKVDDAEKMQSLAYSILQGAIQALEVQPRRNLAESRTIKAAAKQKAASKWGGIAAAAGGFATAAKPFIDGSREIAADPDLVSQVIEKGWAWAQALEIGVGVCLFAAVAFFVFQRVQANRIQKAREEDFEKGLE